MENKHIFVDGLKWYDANENAPSFVKGSISVDPKKLIDFLKNNVQYMSEKGYMTFDMKESRGGDIYFELNTYKKKVEHTEPQGTERVDFPKSTLTSTGLNGEAPIDMSQSPF